MSNDNGTSHFLREGCLTEDDLYGYISGHTEIDRLSLLEAHLAKCPDCRRALADLLELLHPNAGFADEETPQPTKAELKQTLALIRKASPKEHSDNRSLFLLFRWPVAAAIVIACTLSIIGYKYFYEINKAESFFAQAKLVLEQGYTGASPSNLRLALPFNSTAINRQTVNQKSLHSAENLFYQALAVNGNMAEARLGLAYIYLSALDLERARDEFQEILDTQDKNTQALIGRGVVRYEQAIQNSDAMQRITLLNAALNDFDAVLKLNPDSAEALYNEIWTLYESGLHKEALQQIKKYLSSDDESIWAEALKNLTVKIQSTDLGALEKEVNKAARLRDRAVLEGIACQAPYQIPAAIWSSMRRSLQLDQIPVTNGDANSEDLRWAAQIMEAAYSDATGDHSFKDLLEFYAGLSPAQRILKKALDQKFQELVKLYRNGELAEVIHNSESLVLQYSKLKDFWQLFNLHHLRANSLYLGGAQFDRSYAEICIMHDIAERLASPDLIAKALGALANICAEQGKYDESLRYAKKQKNLASTYNLDSWRAHACIMLGNQFRRIGQYEQSLQEYASALGFAYRLQNANQIMECLEKLGIVMDHLGRLQEAIHFFRLASQQQDTFFRNKALQPTPEIVNRRLNLLYRQGDLALRTGDLVSAEELFRESLQSTPGGMRELEARNYIGLAEVYLKKKRMQESENMMEAAMAINASGQYHEIEWQARFIKGEILKETGDHRGAFSSFQQSIEVLEKMRQYVKEEELRQSFYTPRFDPYKATVSLLYGSAKDNRKALEFVDRAKSITLKEHLRILESGENSRNDTVEEYLFPIVEYFFAKDSLLIFITKRGQVEAVSQAISSEILSYEIREYLESIEDNNSETFVVLARKLYGELIAPIEKYIPIEKSETLVILPDGPLHLLPFAGLQDEKGRFLIEKTPIAFAPSRSIFCHCLSLNPQISASNGNDALLIDGSAGLSSARDELAYLAKLYGSNALLLGPRDLPIFDRAAARSEIIHFAGHALTNQGKPRLVLQTFPNEVHLDYQAISGWRLRRTRLVNLAGCNTGIGPTGEGEAPWGLIPAFLNAGAPAIIASLTPVDDSATKQLTCLFYGKLHRGVDKAKALQRAQVELLNSARSGLDIRPKFWSPYVLIGNPH